MATETLVIPLIHPNGTRKVTLITDLELVYAALNEVRKKMKEAAPNGRDYYPLGADAINRATDQHLDRMRRIDAVQDEIQALITAIDAQ